MRSSSKIRLLMVLWLVAAASSSAACSCSSTPPVVEPEDAGPADAAAPEEEPAPVPVLIETFVSTPEVQAGSALGVQCILRDENGDTLDPSGFSPRITLEPTTLFERNAEGALIAQRVGAAEVNCSLPSHGLVSEDPKTVNVVPGPAASVIARLASDEISAGEEAALECLIFDAYGNAVTSASPTLSFSPSGEGASAEGLVFGSTRAGVYELSCLVPGATESESAMLLVKAGLPASMTVSPSPERSLYKRGDQVSLLSDVRDRYGNRVLDMTLAHEASPSATVQGARFSFAADGHYLLTARVSSPTHEDQPVSASVQVTVNSSGPDIECLRLDDSSPSDAYMVNRAPGASVSIPVRVGDTFDVSSVTINGAPATESTPGVYRANHSVTWGMNFFDIVATDEFGQENSKTCVFLASNAWVPEPGAGSTGFLAGSVGLRLDQAAIDDRNTTDGLDSLNDILFTVVNSNGLRQMLNDALVGMNPLYDQCIQRVCPCFGGCCFCAASANVNYVANSLQVNGPNASSLDLIDGGLRLRLTVRNIRANFRVGGTCSGTPQVGINTLGADISFNVGLNGGVLRASVRSVNSITVDGVSVGCQFSFPCNLVCDWFNGTFRDMVRDALRTQLEAFVRQQLGPILDGVVSGLDVSTLGTSFVIPKLDGSGNITLGFGMQLSSASITTSRLLLGLGTRFPPQVTAHSRPSLGVARRAGTVLLDPPGTSSARPVGLSFYEGALNQILHGLWRGGFFQANLSLGAGQATIDARLPPVAYIEGDRARLGLGGIGASVTIPGIIDTPIQVTFGGLATARVSLVGDDLSFGGLAMDELFISFDASLSQSQRDALESFLGGVLETVLVSAINDGLPAIPIPSFTLPDIGFGIPAGAELGIRSPSLSVAGQHFRLTGAFGVR